MNYKLIMQSHVLRAKSKLLKISQIIESEKNKNLILHFFFHVTMPPQSYMSTIVYVNFLFTFKYFMAVIKSLFYSFFLLLMH